MDRSDVLKRSSDASKAGLTKRLNRLVEGRAVDVSGSNLYQPRFLRAPGISEPLANAHCFSGAT